MVWVQTRLEDFVEKRSDRRVHGHGNPGRLIDIHVRKFESMIEEMLRDLDRLAERRR